MYITSSSLLLKSVPTRSAHIPRECVAVSRTPTYQASYDVVTVHHTPHSQLAKFKFSLSTFALFSCQTNNDDGSSQKTFLLCSIGPKRNVCLRSSLAGCCHTVIIRDRSVVWTAPIRKVLNKRNILLLDWLLPSLPFLGSSSFYPLMVIVTTLAKTDHKSVSRVIYRRMRYSSNSSSNKRTARCSPDRYCLGKKIS